jgi:cyclase
MPANRIIPSLLVRRARLVKGVAFAAHRDAGAPASTARAHNAQGADEIILLDIDASREGRGPDLDVVAAVAKEIMVPLTVGGGISSVATARACLNAGADKVCLTTAALDAPQLVTEMARTFGAQAIVVGVDIVRTADGPRLFDHRRGTAISDRDWLAWAHEATSRGAGEIRLAAVDREGARSGLDTDLWRAARGQLHVPLILEGGAGSLEHLAEAMLAGVDSIALGTMLVFSDNNLVKLRRYLGTAGCSMRP